MTHEQQLSNVRYRNWVRGGLAIKYLREGVLQSVEEASKQQHDDMLTDIQTRYSASVCYKCSLQSLLPIHTKDIKGCPLRQRPCNCCNVKGKQLCPTYFCSAMYDKVIIQHRFSSPNWKNTDIRQWHCNHWQIAKCYIPGGGYETKSSSAETDCSGLLNVIINSWSVQNSVDCTIDPPEDIFSKTRKARDEIFHSSDMELDEVTLTAYIDDMIAILDDKKLCQRPEAMAAKQKLQQLRNDSFVVTTQNEDEMRKIALAAIEEKKQEALQLIDSTKASMVEHIEDRLAELKSKEANLTTRQEYDAYRLELENMKAELNSMKENQRCLSTKDDLQQETSNIEIQLKSLEQRQSEFLTKTDYEEQNYAVQDIRNQLTKLKEAFDEIKSIEKVNSERIKQGSSSGQPTIEEMLTSNAQHSKQSFEEKEVATKAIEYQEKQLQRAYLEKKRVLQTDLIEMYQQYQTMVSVLPLMPEEESNVDDVYVQPDMVIEDQETSASSSKILSSVTSYKDIFYWKDKKRKKIYLSGDAGMGKSTFCKKLIYQWCKIHSTIKDDKKVEAHDVLEEYEFLFYISLRHAVTEIHVHDMIKSQLLDESEHIDVFEQVLSTDSKRCLIILDGLDEWNPELLKKDLTLTHNPLQNRNIPRTNPVKKYTLLTTTRPWKMEATRLKTSDVDLHVKLRGLSSMSVEIYIERVTDNLNSKFMRSKKSKDFMRALESQKVSDLKYVPVVLLQLFCLWHDGTPFGSSLCDIYSNMLNLLFKVTKCPITLMQKDTIDLPACFAGKEMCLENRELVFKLAYIAFDTLFSESHDSKLVFNRSAVEACGVTSAELDLLLKIGILTESRVVRKAASTRMTSLSFLHKSFQEFLAAVYISTAKPPSLKRSQIHLNDKEVTRSQKELSADKSFEKVFNTCNNISVILEMENIFVFVSGMNSALAKLLLHHVNVTLDNDEYVRKYRESLPDVSGNRPRFSNMHNIQNLYESCIEELQCVDKQINLKSTLRMGDILSGIKFTYFDPEYIKSLHISVGSTLDDSSLRHITESRFLEKLDTKTDTGSDLIEFACHLMSMAKDSLITLVIELTGHVKKMPQVPTLIPGLRNVYLDGINLFHEEIEKFMSFLSNAKTLRAIHLSHIVCAEHKPVCSFSIPSIKDNQVHKLELTDVCINININPDKLRHCHLEHLSQDPCGIIGDFSQAPSLQTLRLHNSILRSSLSQNTITSLAKALPKFNQLEALSLSHVDFGNRDLQISSCTHTIKNVELNSVILSHEALETYMDSIVNITHAFESSFRNIKIVKNSPTETEAKGSKSIVEKFTIKQNFESFDRKEKSLAVQHVHPTADEIPPLYYSLKERISELTIDLHFKNRQKLTDDTVKALVDLIPQLHTLERLRLDDVQFKQASLRLSPEMKMLKEIKLYRCSLAGRTFKSFLDTIPELRHVLKISADFLRVQEDTKLDEIPKRQEDWESEKFKVTCHHYISKSDFDSLHGGYGWCEWPPSIGHRYISLESIPKGTIQS